MASACSAGVSVFGGHLRGPQRPSSPALSSVRHLSTVRDEIPIIEQTPSRRAPAAWASDTPPESLLALLVGVVVLVLLVEVLHLFLSTNRAAASARAFSLRASSRSSLRIRLVVAL